MENYQFQNQIHLACHFFFVEPKLLESETCKSKMGASVSEALALFHFSSDGYI